MLTKKDVVWSEYSAHCLPRREFGVDYGKKRPLLLMTPSHVLYWIPGHTAWVSLGTTGYYEGRLELAVYGSFGTGKTLATGGMLRSHLRDPKVLAKIESELKLKLPKLSYGVTFTLNGEKPHGKPADPPKSRKPKPKMPSVPDVPLEPGPYVLQADVANPERDLRKAGLDWRNSQGWKKGEVFWVLEEEIGGTKLLEFRWSRGYRSQTLSMKDDRVRALAPHLKPCEDKIDILCWRLEAELYTDFAEAGKDLLLRLLRTNQVSEEAVMRAGKELRDRRNA